MIDIVYYDGQRDGEEFHRVEIEGFVALRLQKVICNEAGMPLNGGHIEVHLEESAFSVQEARDLIARMTREVDAMEARLLKSAT